MIKSLFIATLLSYTFCSYTMNIVTSLKDGFNFHFTNNSTSDRADQFITQCGSMKWQELCWKQQELSTNTKKILSQKIQSNDLLQFTFNFALLPTDIQNKIVDHLFNQHEESKNIFLQGIIKRAFEFLSFSRLMEYKEKYQFGKDEAFSTLCPYNNYWWPSPLLVLTRSEMFHLSHEQRNALHRVTENNILNKQQLMSLCLLSDTIKEQLEKRAVSVNKGENYHKFAPYKSIIKFKSRTSYYNIFYITFITITLKKIIGDILIPFCGYKAAELMLSECNPIEPESNIIKKKVIAHLKLSSDKDVADYHINMDKPLYSLWERLLVIFYKSISVSSPFISFIYSDLSVLDNKDVKYFDKTYKIIDSLVFAEYINAFFISIFYYLDSDNINYNNYKLLLALTGLSISLFYSWRIYHRIKEDEWTTDECHFSNIPSRLKTWYREVQ